jgi:hypothetical protein
MRLERQSELALVTQYSAVSQHPTPRARKSQAATGVAVLIALRLAQLAAEELTTEMTELPQVLESANPNPYPLENERR